MTKYEQRQTNKIELINRITRYGVNDSINEIMEMVKNMEYQHKGQNYESKEPYDY